MLGKTQNASGAKWVFGVNGSEQVFISISDGTTTTTETGATTISIGEWVHVVGVYDTDADTLSVFLNGVQDATMSASGIGSLSNSLDLRSGRGAEYPYNYNNAFDVCNIAIWKRVLTPEEIQSIKNKSYSQLKGVEKTSLVSWWGLDNSLDRGVDFWDVGVFTQEGSPTTSTYSNGLLNVVGNGNNTGARFSFPSTGSTSIEGYNQYEFSFDIKITSSAPSNVKIQYHYSNAISSTFNNHIDTTEAPNQEFKRFVTTLYSDNSLSSNRYFVFVQSGSTVAEFQVKNIV